MMMSSATPGMLRNTCTYRSPTMRKGLKGDTRITVMSTASTITMANEAAVMPHVTKRPLR